MVAIGAVAALAACLSFAAADPFPLPSVIHPPSNSISVTSLLLDTRAPSPTQPSHYSQHGHGHDLRRREEDSDSGKQPGDEGSERESTSTSHHAKSMHAAETTSCPTTDGKGDRPQSTREDHKHSTRAESEPSRTTMDDVKTKTVPTKAMETVSTLALNLHTSADASTPVASSVPMPSAFDGVSSSQFAISGDSDGSCPRFIQGILDNSIYKSCWPLSMMLQTSQSLFDAEKHLYSIVQVLDAACAVDSEQCADFFRQAAANLTMEGNCKAEHDANQYLVGQAYAGMRAYETLYTATCLQDPDQDMYCFANAVTNNSIVSDAYLYFMPLGSSLPGGSTPSCNWCTKSTMDVFHAASADRSSLVAGVYTNTSTQINTLCGVNFVNSTLPPEDRGSGSVRFSGTSTLLLFAVSFAALWMAGSI